MLFFDKFLQQPIIPQNATIVYGSAENCLILPCVIILLLLIIIIYYLSNRKTKSNEIDLPENNTTFLKKIFNII